MFGALELASDVHVLPCIATEALRHVPTWWRLHVDLHLHRLTVGACRHRQLVPKHKYKLFSSTTAATNAGLKHE